MSAKIWCTNFQPSSCYKKVASLSWKHCNYTKVTIKAKLRATHLLHWSCSGCQVQLVMSDQGCWLRRHGHRCCGGRGGRVGANPAHLSCLGGLSCADPLTPTRWPPSFVFLPNCIGVRGLLLWLGEMRRRLVEDHRCLHDLLQRLLDDLCR